MQSGLNGLEGHNKLSGKELDFLKEVEEWGLQMAMETLEEKGLVLDINIKIDKR
jgi:hypothetical protein